MMNEAERYCYIRITDPRSFDVIAPIVRRCARTFLGHWHRKAYVKMYSFVQPSWRKLRCGDKKKVVADTLHQKLRRKAYVEHVDTIDVTRIQGVNPAKFLAVEARGIFVPNAVGPVRGCLHMRCAYERAIKSPKPSWYVCPESITLG